MLENTQQEVQLCRSLAPLIDALLNHLTQSSLVHEYHAWLRESAGRPDLGMRRFVALTWGDTEVLLFAAPRPLQFVLAVVGDEFRVVASIIEGAGEGDNQMRISELAGCTQPVHSLVTHLVALLRGTTIGALSGGAHASMPSA